MYHHGTEQLEELGVFGIGHTIVITKGAPLLLTAA
jgi:hypothetical protein